MDGRKERVIRSLQFRLSLALSLAILAAAAAAGGYTYRSAYREAYELQDDVLAQVATLMDRQQLAPAALADPQRRKESDEASDVIVQRLGPHETNEAALPLPTDLAEGLQDVAIGLRRYRVLVRPMADGARIAVTQDGAFRDQIAADAARRSLAPFAVLLPVLLGIVAILVRGLVRPVVALAGEVDRRDARDLTPVSLGQAPAEVAPFVAAINRLLARLDQAMEAQRRFVADSAHELRSPMTALSLQAEGLEGADLPPATREKLNELRQGVARGRKLIEQLLAMARAQSNVERLKAPVSIHGVFRRALEDLLPLAEDKGVDVGVEGGVDVKVLASEIDLVILVRNLVDNAIRHTPPAGRVDLSVACEDDRVVLSVCDTGPGIAPEERARVFDPFYRILGGDESGSGLGLSIVRTIAERLGGEAGLSYGDEAAGTGLCVRVSLPVEG